eukprot:GEMP01023114.1.p1 GENE.GEMP01023114.1~~GEMP01023114.1.p1  ORF type:complete len:608 (-),score=140.65 GEMP01023114.1:582-2405(-)
MRALSFLFAVSTVRVAISEESPAESDHENAPSVVATDVVLRREKVEVAFSAGGDGLLTLTVFHNGERVVCRGLTSYVSHETEMRQRDGSFKKVRGTPGYLLQSSVDGMECRVALLNADRRPYTIADVPAPPSDFTARIVLFNGEVLDVERDEATGEYFHTFPHHIALGHRRRLQSYHEFYCKFTERKKMKMGVVVDQPYLTNLARNDKDTALDKIQALWKSASVVYEKQMNIEVTVGTLLFHTDESVRGQNWARCGNMNQREATLRSFGAWSANKFPKKMAGWYLAAGCNFSPGREAGAVQHLGCIGNGGNCFGVSTAHSKVTSHEIGHMFGATHTGSGVMVAFTNGRSEIWNGLYQFSQSSTQPICDRSVKVKERSDNLLAPADEIWDNSQPDSSTPKPPSATPAPPTRPPAPTPTPPTTRPPAPAPTPATPALPAPPGSSTPKPPGTTPPSGTDPNPPSSDPPKDDAEAGSNTTLYAILGVAGGLLLLYLVANRGKDDSAPTSRAQHARGRKAPSGDSPKNKTKESGKKTAPQAAKNTKTPRLAVTGARKNSARNLTKAASATNLTVEDSDEESGQGSLPLRNSFRFIPRAQTQGKRQRPRMRPQ